MNIETGQYATKIASEIYDSLLQHIIIKKVIAEDRLGVLSEDAKKRIFGKATHIDHRVIRLMAISGKGGWHPDKTRRCAYALNTNITLLDHLLSVVRGSITLASLAWLSENPEMNEIFLKKQLTVMATIAFLHDADKDLCPELQQQDVSLSTSRQLELTPQHIETLYIRYDIAEFLQSVNVTLSPEQMLYLLEKVEATQAHRHPPKTLPPRDFEPLTLWVRLADKLDGAYQKEGLNAVLTRLEKDNSCLDEKNPLRTDWQALDIFDPHHPFLLDELQQKLALACYRLTSLFPLLETHQDGRLLMILPKKTADQIIERAIQRLCDSLPFELELKISTPGTPALYNGQPSHEELTQFIENLPLTGSAKQSGISELLRIQVKYATPEIIGQLDVMLENVGLQPRLPQLTGQLIRLYSSFEKISEVSQLWVRKAAHVVLLLNVKLETKAKDKIPKPKQREQELLNVLKRERPAWISEIEHDYTRSVLSTLWIVSLAVEDDTLNAAIWGDNGLLKQWLEDVGFNRFITGRGAQVIAGVKRHFQQLFAKQRIFPENELEKQGRCLFTEEPVDFNDTIDDALGLYGVKMSAFSGRDQRPESILFDQNHTNVSPVSIAEHKLRTIAHARQGGKENGVPTLISSPSTLGLFGGLRLTNDQQLQGMSLYDLNRLEVKKGTVVQGMEIYQNGRYRIARLERLAEKTVDQVDQLRMLLKACQRVGRPIHVFRGLPTPQRAFFYYDALPRLLMDLLNDLTDDDNKRALRLEKLTEALNRLETARMILETNGLGYDILRLYATPSSRFGAICWVACHFMDSGNTGQFFNFQKEYLIYQEEQLMNENKEGALIRLGQAAAKIQNYIGIKDSTNEQLLVFKICLETVNNLRSIGQTDAQSLIFSITGELEDKLSKKHKNSGKWLVDGCREVAELFVNEVWLGVLKGRAPSQRHRRVLASIYRMASLQAHKERVEAKKVKGNPEEVTE